MTYFDRAHHGDYDFVKDTEVGNALRSVTPLGDGARANTTKHYMVTFPPTGTADAIAIVGSEGHASQRWVANAIELNRHTTCMKVTSVVSLSFILPHPPEDEKKKGNILQHFTALFSVYL